MYAYQLCIGCDSDIFHCRHGLTNSANHLVLSCNGNETHILNCDQIQITDFGICTHLEDVEIICCEFL